jgi:hypothetical protein
MRKTLNRSVTFKLGRQDERAFRRSRRGRQIWELVPGGATFATLFPEYVGTELTITNKGIELAGNVRGQLLCQWLSANGYL